MVIIFTDHVKPRSLFNIEDINDRRILNHWSNLQPLEKYENMKKSNTYNDEIELNHTTKILRFLDHLDKTNPYLCKFATESYSNLYKNLYIITIINNDHKINQFYYVSETLVSDNVQSSKEF